MSEPPYGERRGPVRTAARVGAGLLGDWLLDIVRGGVAMLSLGLVLAALADGDARWRWLGVLGLAGAVAVFVPLAQERPARVTVWTVLAVALVDVVALVAMLA